MREHGFKNHQLGCRRSGWNECPEGDGGAIIIELCRFNETTKDWRFRRACTAELY
jgi:hypothetical protein